MWTNIKRMETVYAILFKELDDMAKQNIMKRANHYEIYPKNRVGKDMIYWNMSNHYRRLYNAKPCVDTNMPRQKLNPFARCDWKQTGKLANQICDSSSYCCPSSTSPPTAHSRSHCRLDSDQQNEGERPFQPNIIKTDVQSKLRSLQVYHPPRRKKSSKSIQEVVEDVDPDCWVGKLMEDESEKRPPSKQNSSDSAYTEEGVSSGGMSRGESPEQLSLPSPVSTEWQLKKHTPSRISDALYVQFVRNITEEILEKDLFTNKALKQVFRDHIQANRLLLDVERMEAEIDKLQLELGIPKEDYLDSAVFGLGNDPSMLWTADGELLQALVDLGLSPSEKEAHMKLFLDTGQYGPSTHTDKEAS